MAYTLGELAEHVQGTLKGDADCQVNSVASLEAATTGDISFITKKEFLSSLSTTSASAVILSEEFVDECPVTAIVSDNPHLAFTRIAQLLYPAIPVDEGIHSSAIVHESANIHNKVAIAANVVIGENVSISEGVHIGPGCVLEAGVKIGQASRLTANITICQGASIGERVIIHPGVVIGADGFGLSNDNGAWLKVPQIGSVIIGDDVEIGANTTIDRGALDNTVIGNGVKLDNQIQVAHNVIIGDNTAIAGCAGIAGSARIGSGCTIGGGVGILGHIDIVDDVHVTAMSFVTKSIDMPGIYSSGTPLQGNQEWRRNTVRYRQLDDMAKRLKRLEKKLESTEKE